VAEVPAHIELPEAPVDLLRESLLLPVSITRRILMTRGDGRWDVIPLQPREVETGRWISLAGWDAARVHAIHVGDGWPPGPGERIDGVVALSAEDRTAQRLRFEAQVFQSRRCPDDFTEEVRSQAREGKRPLCNVLDWSGARRPGPLRPGELRLRPGEPYVVTIELEPRVRRRGTAVRHLPVTRTRGESLVSLPCVLTTNETKELLGRRTRKPLRQLRLIEVLPSTPRDAAWARLVDERWKTRHAHALEDDSLPEEEEQWHQFTLAQRGALLRQAPCFGPDELRPFQGNAWRWERLFVPVWPGIQSDTTTQALTEYWAVVEAYRRLFLGDGG